MAFENWRHVLRLRLRSLFRVSDVERELDDELRYHLEQQIALNVERGMTPLEARRSARLAMGGLEQRKEQCRDTRRVATLAHVVRDLRLAGRTLARQPLLVLATAMSIAVSIGANTTIASLASQFLLSAPTAQRPDRLVYISMGHGSHVSYRQWRDLQASGALEGLAGYQIEQEINWRAGDRAITLVPLLVTGNFFDVLGAPVALGRSFTARDVERDPHVAVVSHGFWQRHLGADVNAPGRSLTLNGVRFSIVGVLPADWRSLTGYGLAPELYVPVSRSLVADIDEPLAATVQLVGRLRDDQSLASGRAAMSAVGQRLAPSYRLPRFGELWKFSPVTLGPSDFPALRAFLVLLFVVVGLVLAIGCANVTGLLLARGTVRRREMAVRAALGAGRGRLVQQLLAESLWLAFVGGLAGLTLTVVVVPALARIPLPLPIPIQLVPPLDLRLALYTFALILVAAMLAGVAPALKATRPPLTAALTQNEPRYTRRRWTLRGVLVLAQVALSLVLLATALLFLRNLARTHAANPGFDTVHTVVAQVRFVDGRHTLEGRTSLLLAAIERLHAVPGVRTASFALAMPLTIRSGRSTGAQIRSEGSTDSFPASYEENLVGPGYFGTMGIPLVGGREFTARDGVGAPSVIVVNREFVRRHFPDRDPIGIRLLLPGGDAPEAAEIVGIAGNSKHRMLGETQQAAIYRSYLQAANTGQFVHILARADDPGAVLRTVESAIADLDRTAAVDVKTMPDMLAFAFLPSQVGAFLLVSLGTLGLILAMGGLFELVSYSAARRTTEIGIRMALGASRAAVIRLVLGEAAVLVGCGIVVGLAIAVIVTRPLAMFLVADLNASDPLTFVGTAVVLGLVSIAASWVPTLRATRIQPAAALHDE
jgi:putative ABC transport system permease protein